MPAPFVVPAVTGSFCQGALIPGARACGSVASMTSDSVHRSIRLERTANSRYVTTNDRGGQISMGTGEGTDFTPVDLLLAAIGGCTGADGGIPTARRAQPGSVRV